MRDVLDRQKTKVPIRTASYETTDATVDSQIVSLQASGANVLVVGGIPKFAAQAIRKVREPQLEADVLYDQRLDLGGRRDAPVRRDNGIGILSTGYLKDPTDPSWDQRSRA